MTAVLHGPSAPCCCSRITSVRRLPSSIAVLRFKNQGYHPYGSCSQLFLPSLSPWRGLKHFCHSFPSNCKHLEKAKSRCMVVYASLFGVGAPEVLVIGVVALLVFGPKGLAEVARNLGKTLREFQPTIRELQEVSKEFRSTLEREIKLNEVDSSANNSYKFNSILNDNLYTASETTQTSTAASEINSETTPSEDAEESK